MERWTLYTATEYDAMPWPAGWTFGAEPDDAAGWPGAVDHFSRGAACDGHSETPTVPADLPRQVCAGRYRAAVYHDPAWLYVLLETCPPPPVHQQRERYEDQAAVILASADGQWLLTGRLHSGKAMKTLLAGAGLGPRQIPPPPLEQAPHWEGLRTAKDDGRRLYAWRWRRSELGPWWDGCCYRLSVACYDTASVEAVAWGSQQHFAPRVDQMIRVRPVPAARPKPWPVVCRAVLAYDPMTERGRLELDWDSLPQAAERYPRHPIHGAALEPITQARIWWNTQTWEQPLVPCALTPEFEVLDGCNHLRASTAGGEAVRLSFEKCSGNRLELPHGPAAASPRDHTWLIAKMTEESSAVLAWHRDLRRRGEALAFRPWGTFVASSIARAVTHLGLSRDLLEVVSDEVEMSLKLQREDGTYAASHMRHAHWANIRWAGGAYDTGPAGELWIIAHRVLGDERCLRAAERLLHAYATYRIEFNHNYAAFTLYHLAEHYRLTGDPLALEHGLYYAQHLAGTDLLPHGFQGGHNHYTCYGGITLRGLALLADVMPRDHPFRPVLRERCLRMANQVIRRLCPDGMVDGRDRHHLDLRYPLIAVSCVAPLLDDADLTVLDEVIQRMLAVWDTLPPLDPAAPVRPFHRLIHADLVRYWAARQGGRAWSETW